MLDNKSQLVAAIESCEREPIQIPGAIQSHGILITLRSSDFTILQISESVNEILGIHHSELLHQPLSKLMPIESVERATKRLGDRTPRLLNPIPLEVEVRGKTKRLDGILHRAGRVLILELEEHVDEDKGYGGFGGFYEAIREVASKMMVTENLSEVMEMACQEIRKLTGFSRVLVYQFDEDWNGEVINESKDDGVETLLHHHFPASDIPKQARELYTTNWLRLIPNVKYRASPIVPTINPITDKALDLSNSVLRSVSPVHLEYMRNMGQAASMSVSLLKGKKLWGLISCHHPKAHYLKYDVRVAAEFVGQMVSAQIVAREDVADIDHKLQLKKLYDDLLRFGGGYSSILHSFGSNATSLLALTDSQGAALFIEGRCLLVGSTPDEGEAREIRNWALESGESIISTEDLASLSEKKLSVSGVSCGLLFINLVRNSGDAILWFRSEVRSQTKWAGDPSSSKQILLDGKIHPRTSFETWFQNAEGKARKWLPPEINAADELRTSILAIPLDQLTYSPERTNAIFRNSLANSMATTEATKTSRTPDQLHSKVPDSLALTSKTEAMLDGFTDFAMLILSENGEIENWTDGARKLFGYSRGQIVGKRFQLFFSEELVLQNIHHKILETSRIHNRYEEETWMFRADGTSFWGKLIVNPIRDRAQTRVGFSLVIQDVTSEKAAEEEVKATRLSAEAASQAKSAFLANISHEIRTPLGAVLGFSELMSAHGIANAEKDILFSKVKRNGEQLTVLINDLLDISKVESGKIEIEALRVDLNLFLSDLESLFKFKAAEKGIELDFVVNGMLPSLIITDPTRLRQIVVNLLSNAIKFTPNGGAVTLTCEIEPSNQKPKIAFRVKDTGKGMSESEMSKLFQPFVQADVSTTRKYGGTGLGLFLSQKLARALGGDLSIERSEVGVGSTFVAKVEVVTVDAAENFNQVSDPAPSLQSESSESALKGLRVLIVDDSADNRELFKTYLGRAGAKVDLAENGQIGVSKALAGSFDCVLMDIQMPVTDGNEAMRMLVSAGYRIPVIALTAHAMKAERDFSIAQGFADYLTKPINRGQLIERLKLIEFTVHN